jgi:lambda family phage portal protein
MATPTTPPLNAVDRLVGFFSPASGLRRWQARQVYNQVSAAQRPHEATESGRLRKFATDGIGPNGIVGASAAVLRAQARHMERNTDIGRGILTSLVNNTIGPTGIGIEPQPRQADGTIHEVYAAQLRTLYREFCLRPEVTGLFKMSALQRMVAKAWLRDGEAFGQHLVGPVPGLQHASPVPYSLEVFEADFVPLDLSDGNALAQGIQRNAWGRPTGYWVYKGHPKESTSLASGKQGMKLLPAEKVVHLALRDRLGQLRGYSIFASIINRLQDVKEYEDSERIAAKVAAALTAYVKRSAPDGYNPADAVTDPATGQPAARQINLAPGTIIDTLAPGEEIGLIDSKRPNPNVITFRQGQLRAVAAGVGASYSTISRDYGGTYSAQRQELVEQWINYATLTDEFVAQWLEPIWQQFVHAAHLSGQAPYPRDLLPGSADDALFIAQSMPWIDPMKEASAYVTLVQAGFASEVEVARKRGVNPRDLLDQITQWRKQTTDRELVFTSNAAHSPSHNAAAAAEANAKAAEAAAVAADSAPSAKAMVAAVAGSHSMLGGVQATLQAMAGAQNVVAQHLAKPAEPAQTIIHNHPQASTVTVQNQVQPTPVEVHNQVQPAAVEVHNQVAVPEAVINVTNQVQPADVVVNNTHPARAIQTVERDKNDEITRTVTTYEA